MKLILVLVAMLVTPEMGRSQTLHTELTRAATKKLTVRMHLTDSTFLTGRIIEVNESSALVAPAQRVSFSAVESVAFRGQPRWKSVWVGAVVGLLSFGGAWALMHGAEDGACDECLGTALTMVVAGATIGALVSPRRAWVVTWRR